MEVHNSCMCKVQVLLDQKEIVIKLTNLLWRTALHRNTYQCQVSASIENKDKIYGQYLFYSFRTQKASWVMCKGLITNA